MSSAPTSNVIHWRFQLWLGLMLAMLVIFAWRVWPNLKIETDILALLPSEQGDVASNAAVDRFSEAIAAKVVWLVGGVDAEHAKQAAEAFAAPLQQSKAFAEITLHQDGMSQALLDLYRPHRAYLLSQRQFDLLQDGQGAQLQQEALRAAFTPSGLMRMVGFADDPLGLANDYFLQQLSVTGAAQLDGKYLTVNDAQEDAERSYVLITAELTGSPFATQVQEDATEALTQAQQQAQQAIAPLKLDVVMSGSMQHAKAARERATSELSTFGTIETIAVMALLIAVFSALRPLALGALTMTLAFVAGICATHYAFGTVHVLALVFGSSLIGGVIDYSIHFFADRFRGDPDWTPASAVEHVGGAILLGLATTLLGYVVLLLVPFPGLRQIALFCVAGLATGCLTVLCAYPVLYRVPAHRAAWGPRIGAWLAQLFVNWRWSTLRNVAALLLVAIALMGIARVHLQDDVRALQASPPELIAAEQRMAALLKSGIESRYFLVQANAEQTLLQVETQLTQRLDKLKRDNKLAGYTAVSRVVPSLAQQQASHTLIEQQIVNNDGALPSLLKQLGFTPDQTRARVQAFAVGSEPMQINDWLQSDASRPYRSLWLGKLDGRYGSIVSLTGVKDVPALQTVSAGLSGVQLIDRVQSVSDVLRSYRQAMSWLLCAVYGVAMLLLSSKFGWRETPLLLLPSALASGVTLGLFGWFGVPVNLFTLLALWLVLGLGVDYGIFLRHGRTALPTAVLSVSLSATTTLLAFGMLAFSATPFIRSIGLTLLLAISLSWLFAMLSCLSFGAPEDASIKT